MAVPFMESLVVLYFFGIEGGDIVQIQETRQSGSGIILLKEEGSESAAQ